MEVHSAFVLCVSVLFICPRFFDVFGAVVVLKDNAYIFFTTRPMLFVSSEEVVLTNFFAMVCFLVFRFA